MVGPSQNMVVKSVVGWQLCLAARIRKDMGAQPIQTQGDPEKNLFPFLNNCRFDKYHSQYSANYYSRTKIRWAV